MKKLLEVTLGIVTSFGGFLEAGSIATAVQAGAAFGYQLSWAVVLGFVCLIFLIEMSGRLAAVSHHTVAGAMRERFGYDFFLVPLIGVGLVSLLVLASELGGVALALQFITGVSFRWFVIPVALFAWAFLWKGTFKLIENGVSMLGLVSIVFVVGAIAAHPDWHAVAHALLPTRPASNGAHYWYVAVSIIGASISPYLMWFYSAGAIEDEWDESHIPINRVVATFGMTFGGLLSLAALVVAGRVMYPAGIQVERYEQVALVLVPTLGHWGFILFVATLGITCFGAALEIALALAYVAAQGFGWRWSEDIRPRDSARFTLVYTGALAAAAIVMLLGVAPLKLTVFSMALTAATLPVGTFPFLLIMNDEDYMGEHRNGWLSNIAVVAIIGLAGVLAVVSIPLQILGAD